MSTKSSLIKLPPKESRGSQNPPTQMRTSVWKQRRVTLERIRNLAQKPITRQPTVLMLLNGGRDY